jgi:hypothetical protein
MATKAATSKHTVILIVTLVATPLSLISAFLFSRAIRYAIAAHTARPVYLHSFSNTFKLELPKGWVRVNVRYVRWAIASHCILTFYVMELGLVKLVTPRKITVMAAIVGDELDLASAAYNDLLRSHTKAVGDLHSLFFSPAFQPIVDANGLVSAGRSSGIPGIVNFNGVIYNASTGGTLPVVLNKPQTHGSDAPSGFYGFSWRGGILPSHAEVQGRYLRPSDFNTNYTVIQQGFTANVSCQAQKPSTIPFLTVSSQKIYSDERVGHLRLWETNTTCALDSRHAGAEEIVLTDPTTPNFVIGKPCWYMNTSSVTQSDPFSHVFLLLGNGAYDFIRPTVCTVIPKITTVQVTYGPLVNVSRTISDWNAPGGSIEDNSHGIVAFTSLQSFFTRLSSTQSLYENGFGDAIASVYQSRVESLNGTAEEKGHVLNIILEDYLTGLTEIMGSILRTAYTADGMFPNNIIPSNMTTSVRGTILSETMGWDHRNHKVVFVAPVALTLLYSIIMLATSIHRTKAKLQAEELVDGSGDAIRFNPSYPIQRLVITTGVDDLGNTVGDFRRSDMAGIEKIRVRSGHINNEKVALLTDSEC